MLQYLEITLFVDGILRCPCHWQRMQRFQKEKMRMTVDFTLLYNCVTIVDCVHI